MLDFCTTNHRQVPPLTWSDRALAQMSREHCSSRPHLTNRGICSMKLDASTRSPATYVTLYAPAPLKWDARKPLARQASERGFAARDRRQIAERSCKRRQVTRDRLKVSMKTKLEKGAVIGVEQKVRTKDIMGSIGNSSMEKI